MMIGKMHIWLFVFMFLAHHLDAARSLELSDRRQLGGQSQPALTQAQLNKVCGVSSINGKWSGRDFPWMVAISSNQKRFYAKCGGSLISEQYVLTAAQCVVNQRNGFKQPAGEFNVRLGGYDISDGGTAVNYKVSEVITHPKFNISNLDNDIALLRLVKRVEFGVSIAPICLPSMSQVIEVGAKPTIAGWGSVGDMGNAVTRLNFIQVNAMSTAECLRVVGKVNYTVTHSQLCTSHLDEGKGACLNDEGGPLMLSNADGRATAIAIITTVQCHYRPGKVDIYTKVNPYLTWIKKNAHFQ